jgi:plasmid stabilization system protein ParE
VTSSFLSGKEVLKLQREVDEAVLNLEAFPEIGKMRDVAREDIRILWVREYRLTYILDYDQDEILIFSFISGRRRSDALD